MKCRLLTVHTQTWMPRLWQSATRSGLTWSLPVLKMSTLRALKSRARVRGPPSMMHAVRSFATSGMACLKAFTCSQWVVRRRYHTKEGGDERAIRREWSGRGEGRELGM